MEEKKRKLQCRHWKMPSLALGNPKKSGKLKIIEKIPKSKSNFNGTANFPLDTDLLTAGDENTDTPYFNFSQHRRPFLHFFQLLEAANHFILNN